MLLRRLSARLLAAGVIALAGSATASAQWVGSSGCASPGVPSLFGGCGATNQGTYGPSLFAPNKDMSRRPQGGSQPLCANNNYPLSDWNYIRKYCGPTFVPGSCYGHFQTKWRKWEDICPNGAADGTCVPNGGAAYADPAPQPTYVPPQVYVPPVTTAPALVPVPSTPAPSTPAPMPAPVDPVAPPKVPAVPKLSAAAPTGVPAQMPTEAKVTATINPAEHGKLSAEPPAVRPLPEAPRVVVPPLPDTPQK